MKGQHQPPYSEFIVIIRNLPEPVSSSEPIPVLAEPAD
jgi:hypothetical protein